MNYWWILLVVVVVVFMFSGGKVEKKGGKSVIHSFPTKLKSGARSLTSGNKMVIGILVGLALCWFLGNGLVEGFDFSNPDTLTAQSLEFQGTCCNLYDGSLKQNFAVSEDEDRCNNTDPDTVDLKTALCAQGMQIEFRTLVGAPANAQFKQTCCPNESNPKGFALSESEMQAGSTADACFTYAFGEGVEDIVRDGIGALFEKYNEFQEICS